MFVVDAFTWNNKVDRWCSAMSASTVASAMASAVASAVPVASAAATMSTTIDVDYSLIDLKIGI